MQEKEILECGAIIQTADQSEDHSKMFSLRLFNGALVASDKFIRGPGGDQQLQDMDTRLTGLANQLTKSHASRQSSRQSSKQSRTSQICYLTVWFCYAGCVLIVSLATTVQLVEETAAQVLFGLVGWLAGTCCC